MFNVNKFTKQEKEALKTFLGSKGVLSVASQKRIKANILTAIAQDSLIPIHEKTTVSIFNVWLFRASVTALSTIVLFSGTAFASSSALPGDILYPIKRAQEKIQLRVAVTEESKANLQAKFAGERFEELGKLTAKYKPQNELKVYNSPLNNSTTTSVIVENNTSSTTSIQTVVMVKSVKQKEIEKKAQKEARAEFKQALTSLRKVHEKQKANGNIKAAEIIQLNIQNLQASAKIRNIEESDTEEDKEQVRGANTVKNKDDKNSDTSNVKNKTQENSKTNLEDKDK